MDSGFQVLAMDSGCLITEVRFRIAIVRGIPDSKGWIPSCKPHDSVSKSQNSGFHRQKFHFQNLVYHSVDWFLDGAKQAFPACWYRSRWWRFWHSLLPPGRQWHRVHYSNRWRSKVDRRGTAACLCSFWELAQWISQPWGGNMRERIYVLRTIEVSR